MRNTDWVCALISGNSWNHFLVN